MTLNTGKIALCLLTSMFCSHVYAGGSFVAARAVAITYDKHYDKFLLALLPEVGKAAGFHAEFDGCDKVTVYGSFNEKRWKSYKRPMSPQTHKASLLALHNTMKTKQAINFGYMGRGLVKVAKCRYKK